MASTPAAQHQRRAWTTNDTQSSVTLDQTIVEDVIRRRPTGLGELDRVLGGGLVPGSFTLLGGDPGIGKSTLLMQLVGALARNDMRSLYVSAEESVSQSALRAQRLGVRSGLVEVASLSVMEEILDRAAHQSPTVLVIDSIQTVYLESLESAPGTVSQVRECAARLLHLAKNKNICVILIGHVTKDGNLAGPKVLEHMVDTVLSFEGDNQQHFRLLRTLKNRFGTTHELGVFEMTHGGLRPVDNPSELFLGERREQTQAGAAVHASIEGTRPLLCEIQGLAVRSYIPSPRRTALGIDSGRLHMLLAVLSKHAGVDLNQHDVFLNVAGGLRLQEPSSDLAAMASLWSSHADQPILGTTCWVGEVGLTGEVRSAAQVELRVREAIKLGFTHFVLPASNKKQVATLIQETGTQVTYLSRVAELHDVFTSKKSVPRSSSAPTRRQADGPPPDFDSF